MKCKEKGCEGKVNFHLEKNVSLQTTTASGWHLAYPCNKCGCLYWKETKKAVVDDVREQKAFLSKKGKVVAKKFKKKKEFKWLPNN